MADFRGSLAEGTGRENVQFYQARLFSMQFELYKRIAGENWKPATTAEKRMQHKKIEKFRELRSVLKKEIADFSRTDFTRHAAEINGRIVSITLFMHLLDLVDKLHPGVMKANRTGLFEIFDGATNQLYVLLASDYFNRPHTVLIRNYLQLEPAISAIADLAGVPMIPVQQAVRDYQPKLSKVVDALNAPMPEKKPKMKAKAMEAKKPEKKPKTGKPKKKQKRKR
ncbi:MAG: hypothetical protein ABII71_02290 [Candidatus Micrarchaeota archaeon]